MSPRRTWRYVLWTRAVHRNERFRALLLDLSNRADRDAGPPPITCRLLDRLALELL